MDTIFAFIQPFVEYVGRTYWEGFVVVLVITITLGMVLIHIERSTDKKYYPDGEDTLGFLFYVSILSFGWPVALAIGSLCLLGWLYYVIVGLILKILSKRIASHNK